MWWPRLHLVSPHTLERPESTPSRLGPSLDLRVPKDEVNSLLGGPGPQSDLFLGIQAGPPRPPSGCTTLLGPCGFMPVKCTDSGLESS